MKLKLGKVSKTAAKYSLLKNQHPFLEVPKLDS